MIHILLVQYDPQTRSTADNMAYLTTLLSAVRHTLVVLPECSFSSYVDYEYVPSSAMADFFAPLLKLTRTNHLSFVGSIPAQSAVWRYNRGFYLSPEGFEVQDKRRLFGAEQKLLHSGKKQSVFTYEQFPFSLQICLDIIDPMQSARMVARGAKSLIVPATVSVDFLRTIAKARALEHSIPVIFCNRTGSERNGIRYLGQSSIFRPDGSEQMLGRENGMLTIQI